MKNTRRRLGMLLMCLGILLVSAALFITVFKAVSDKINASAAEQILTEMAEVMPEQKGGTLDDRENVTMPMIELDGESFIGIIELPQYSIRLPIDAAWDSGKLTKYPCRYSGSLYDGTLIIGGSGSASQLGTLKNMTPTDKVYVTDVMGSRFVYTVEDVYYVKEISEKSLSKAEADVILFSKSAYASDYTVVLLGR